MECDLPSARMRSEGCLSFCLSVCLSVCRRIFSHYRLPYGLRAILTALAQLEDEIKVAISRCVQGRDNGTLRTSHCAWPAHQLAVRVRIRRPRAIYPACPRRIMQTSLCVSKAQNNFFNNLTPIQIFNYSFLFQSSRLATSRASVQ